MRTRDFIEKTGSPERRGLGDAREGCNLARNSRRPADVERIALFPIPIKGVETRRIDIMHCRKPRHIGWLNEEAGADRFRSDDNPLDNLVPTGGVDNGIVDRRNEISAFVRIRQRIGPACERGFLPNCAVPVEVSARFAFLYARALFCRIFTTRTSVHFAGKCSNLDRSDCCL